MNATETGSTRFDRRLGGHPVGLLVLFFTELWERFSYYGMRAILILYLVAATGEGGLGLDVATAGAIYALYTSLVYFAGVPGGWLADKILGHRRAVWIGGSLIALGHFTIAFKSMPTFFGGLGLIILGTGLLKPNISAMVGQMYEPGDTRRDAGFTFFYMGINFGALFGPLTCGWLAERYEWHYGFGAAGVGMVLGLVVYTIFGAALWGVGLRTAPASPEQAARLRRIAGVGAVAAAGISVLVVSLVSTGSLSIVGLANVFGVVLVGLAMAFFGWIFIRGDWSPAERKRLIVILILFVGAAIFWSGYEQAGSSLNLFAKDHTDRSWGDGEFPTAWFQSVPAFYVLVLSVVFTVVWTTLGKRQPGSVAKFALGLVFNAAGFGVMIVAALRVADGGLVGPGWLMAAYFLQVVGEMCLSPIGLSAVTKLAPERVTGMMMGAWFLASSVGSYFAGRAAGLSEALPLPMVFGLVTVVSLLAGIVIALLVRPISRWKLD